MEVNKKVVQVLEIHGSDSKPTTKSDRGLKVKDRLGKIIQGECDSFCEPDSLLKLKDN